MRRGFTVTELVVVVGIMIALAGIGIPIFSGDEINRPIGEMHHKT